MGAIEQQLETTEQHARLATRLRRVIKGEVLFDSASRGRYATDASIYQVNPVGVVIPRDETDVIATLDLARELNVPILPRGAGTSQCGQTVGHALVIDQSKHLNQLINLDVDKQTVQVQPGMVLDHLNAQLKPHGLWFPVDVSTAAQATLGGMAGNNSCGSRSIAYGNMVHNVLGIDALLSDGTQEYFGSFGVNASRPMASPRSAALVSKLFEIGQREKAEIERVWPRVLRRVGGYNLDIFHPMSERPYTTDNSVNLSHLLVGSEGTLAMFRRLHLKLAPLPKHKVLGVVNFTSFHKAMDSAQHIVKLKPVAVELVDRIMIDLARTNPAFRNTMNSALVDPSAPTPEAILLVEFSGEEHAPLLMQIKSLIDLMASLGLPGSVVTLKDATPQRELWEVRKAGLNIMMSVRGDGKPVSFIEDCAVPLEHLAEYTAALTEVFARHGTHGTWYAHASVGTLHVRPILDMRRSGQGIEVGGAEKMRAIAQEASALVRKYKGAFSGEHGDGLVRSEWVGWQFGPRLNRAFEEIKDLFDPAGLMNPGKIVRSTRMDDTSLMRYKPGYTVIPITTGLDWSRWNVQTDALTELASSPGSGGDPAQGLAKAVEMCNNNGHCRKFDAGTMCPSYRVTKDEQHVTRGRANTLRLSLSGQIDGNANALNNPQVQQALDLCVSCKGCKRDCPTGVDMAQMKIEVQHQQLLAGKRLSLRDKLVAYLPRYAPWASRFGVVLNLRNRFAPLAWGMEKVLGFAAQRPLPAWGPRFSSPVVNSPRANPAASTSDKPAQGTTIILWADTFNHYFESDNIKAAVEVLQAIGYSVRLSSAASNQRPLCCGRSFLSKGLVNEARDELTRSLIALRAEIEAGVPVVGLEPSCILGLRDEALVLNLPADLQMLAEKLAKQSYLLEEFLANELESNDENPSKRFQWHALDRPIYLHGHCHQKAFGVMGSVERILRQIPGLELHIIESSCCGMAGSFGYEQEHQEVSKAMAELALMPAVRQAPKAAYIVADGTSCRHQISDLGGREAVHVAKILRALI